MRPRALALVLLAAPAAACSDDDAGSGGSGAGTIASSSTSGTGSPASSTGTGGVGGSDMLCGGERCHADQTCDNDRCTFPCTGPNVPGDYATLEAAVQALKEIPGSVICLAPGDYAEPSFVILGEDLTIIGPSASQTNISLMPSAPVRQNVKFRGVTFTTPFLPSGTLNVDSHIEARSVRFQQGVDIDRGAPGSGGAQMAVLLDACDVAGGIRALDNTTLITGDFVIRVANSFVHDAAVPCVRALLSQSSADLALDLRSNTIVNCSTGIDVNVSSISGANAVVIDLFNNIVAGHSDVGISIQVTSDEILTTANNALFSNTTNYAGAAVDGAGYVKMDCLLDDATTPPGLLPGSPCRDAADLPSAPASDYWGAARGTLPDIGAVEMR